MNKLVSGQDTFFPRTLIVGAAPISNSSATGLTLMNLFNGWPAKSLAQIYDDAGTPDAAVCGSFRRFSSADMPTIRIAKKLLQGIRHPVLDP